MVLRWLFRLFTNTALSEKLVDKLAESWPMRRAAQHVVYFFNKSKSIVDKQNISPEEIKKISSDVVEKLKNIRDELEKKAKK